MSVSIPTPQQQLKFLKQIQQILHSGSFSSTYKFALLMSLSRLAVEQGNDTGENLTLDYMDIAEKFIDLYWKQTLPFHFNENEPFLLQQNNGKQAGIISLIHTAQQSYKSLALARRDHVYWLQLKKKVADIVKKMPVAYLQNLKGQNVEFLYRLEDSQKQLILLPKVMYCLRQFNEIIEELCQKKWVDFVRLNKGNLLVLDGLPDLATFMFEPSRNQLHQVGEFLVDLQACRCFYCQKPIKHNKWAVDHFIPWAMYPVDTGHNFVLADDKCNSAKRDFLASKEFLLQWQERNKNFDYLITEQVSKLGFLTDMERSHSVASWAYGQAEENGYLLWTNKS